MAAILVVYYCWMLGGISWLLPRLEKLDASIKLPSVVSQGTLLCKMVPVADALSHFCPGGSTERIKGILATLLARLLEVTIVQPETKR